MQLRGLSNTRYDFFIEAHKCFERPFKLQHHVLQLMLHLHQHGYFLILSLVICMNSCEQCEFKQRIANRMPYISINYCN